MAFVLGEFDPSSGTYRLHVHGIAVGEMVEVVDRLRTLPNYRTRKHLADGSLNPVYRRIKVTRKPLTDLPKPLTYLLQSYWPSRAIVISDGGKRIRARQKQRLPEPFHSEVLLWLDRWTLGDLTLMVGLRVTKAGLVQTKRRAKRT